MGVDVLETTEESRRNIAAPSGDIILRRKNDEIAELRDEVARLSQNAGAEGNGDDDASKKEAIKSMKYIVKKNRKLRKSHMRKLGALTSQLEENLVSGDLSQMQQLFALAKETILAGEKSNSKMDRETVDMIDNTALHLYGIRKTALLTLMLPLCWKPEIAMQVRKETHLQELWAQGEGG